MKESLISLYIIMSRINIEARIDLL